MLILTDLQLIEEILNGKTGCFEQLVCRYDKSLMRFLKLRCQSSNDAEDIFQETFLNAHLYLRSYDSRFAFSTWLFNISLNLIKKHYKAIKEIENQDNEVVINDKELELKEFSNINNIWIIAKQHLSDEQLNLIWFTYAEEYSGSDVAIILERSLPWVKINLIRVKSLLKTILIEKGHVLNDLVRG